MLSESNSHNNRSILKRLKRVRLDDSVSRTMGIELARYVFGQLVGLLVAARRRILMARARPIRTECV